MMMHDGSIQRSRARPRLSLRGGHAVHRQDAPEGDLEQIADAALAGLTPGEEGSPDPAPHLRAESAQLPDSLCKDAPAGDRRTDPPPPTLTVLSETMYLSITSRKSPPPQNIRLDILNGSSEQ